LTTWRCGGILFSISRQLKPIKDKRFNDFYCCLIYNLKLELPMDSEFLLIAPIPPEEAGQAVLPPKCQSESYAHTHSL
jgi:hypothetical protein